MTRRFIIAYLQFERDKLNCTDTHKNCVYVYRISIHGSTNDKSINDLKEKYFENNLYETNEHIW